MLYFIIFVCAIIYVCFVVKWSKELKAKRKEQEKKDVSPLATDLATDNKLKVDEKNTNKN